MTILLLLLLLPSLSLLLVQSFHTSYQCRGAAGRSIRMEDSSRIFDDAENLEKENYDGIKYLTFVSSNKNKIEEVSTILGEQFPYKLKCHSVDLSEPQATPIEVSRTKCRQAALLCEGPVIVEDTSLCFNALNGLPGPYIKWFYEGIGNEGVAKLLDGFEDKTGYAQCVLSFTLGPNRPVKTFVGSVDGTIVYPTGPESFGWDPIFKPLGSDKTFAQMPKAEKNRMSHRFKALREFKAYINQRTGPLRHM